MDSGTLWKLVAPYAILTFDCDKSRTLWHSFYSQRSGYAGPVVRGLGGVPGRLLGQAIQAGFQSPGSTIRFFGLNLGQGT